MTTTDSSSSSSKSSLLPLFSHLYVEEELFEDAWREKTKSLLQRFPKAEIVRIKNYPEFAQRRSANWNDQKRSPKLILAKKHSELIYPCSDVAPNFGHEHFYYAVPMQNCLYDCEYCYLQGMYTSPNLLYFINQEEMIQAALEHMRRLGSLYLCIAYDNDILALENLLGVAGTWIEGLRGHPDITVEIRTKSANFRPLQALAPPGNVILAWTLSPQTVVERFEAKTPPLPARLKALGQALDKGWRVRLCFDPLLPIKDWKESYGDLLHKLDQLDVWPRVEDVSYGLFRLPKQFLRQAKKARPDSALLHSAQSQEERGLYTLTGTDQLDLLKFMEEALLKRLSAEKVWQT